jgi:hypothetical protein
MKAFKSFRLDLRGLSRLARRDVGFSAQWPEEPLDLPVDQKGGFYPAVLGTKLHSSYTIVQKLGWGQHSNVWLVKDERFVNTILFAFSGQIFDDLMDLPGVTDHIICNISQLKYSQPTRRKRSVSLLMSLACYNVCRI